MKTQHPFARILPLLCLGFSHITSAQAQPALPATGNLTLRIQNVESAEGMVWVGMYNSADTFLNEEKAVKVQGVKVTSAGEVRMSLTDLPFGEYAIALFHDVNNSGRLDQNWVGIPQEPYGFSGGFTKKWRAPYYSEVVFRFSASGQTLPLKLGKW